MELLWIVPILGILTTFTSEIASQCVPQVPDVLGPFYIPEAPLRSDLSRTDPAFNSVRKQILQGRVVTQRCNPVVNAKVDIWYADQRGNYYEGHDIRGFVYTNSTGHYRFRILTPGKYPGRPRHIHVRISSIPGFFDTVTQLYYPDNYPLGFERNLLRPVPSSSEPGSDEIANFDFVVIQLNESGPSYPDYPEADEPFCPALSSSDNLPCERVCERDSDCTNTRVGETAKCCNTTCGSVCRTHVFAVPGVSIERNGELIPSRSNFEYGNTVSQRTGYLTENTRRAFIDTQTSLPAGTLDRFYFYVHGAAQDGNIRLQIWRNNSGDSYKLVYEEAHMIAAGDNGRLYRSYTKRGRFNVREGDRLGFTSESVTFNPISYTMNSAHRLLVHNVELDEILPRRGNDYLFDQSASGVFSIAARVTPDFERADRAGECPVVDSSAACNSNCTIDDECPENEKCCPLPCGQSGCMRPAGTNGPLTPEEQTYNYGPETRQRDSYIASGGRKQYIDYETFLPAGTLTKFSLYVDERLPQQYQRFPIRLQIYRPILRTAHVFQLVFEKRVEIDATSTKSHTITLTEEERFTLVREDRLGWTYESVVGGISMNLRVGTRTLYRHVPENRFPAVGARLQYDFDHLPAEFSISVEVAARKYSYDTVNYHRITRWPKCSPTTPDVLGPFYVPDVPVTRVLGNGHPQFSQTRKIILQGYIYSTDCATRVVGARVDAWAADLSGLYNNSNNIRGYQLTDSNGFYSFLTTWPGQYGSRPRHVHFRVTAPGYQDFVTQIYFGDDIPANKRSNRVTAQPTDPNDPNSPEMFDYIMNISPEAGDGTPPVPSPPFTPDNPELCPVTLSNEVNCETASQCSSDSDCTDLQDGSIVKCCQTDCGRTCLNQLPYNVFERVTLGGSFVPQANRGEFGNTVSQRDRVDLKDAQRTYLDYDTELPAGRLTEFSVFAHPSVNSANPSTAYIRMQVFRFTANYYNLRLVFEKRVRLNISTNTGVLYKFELTEGEKIMINRGDKIGFTNENQFGVVSYTRTTSHRTLSRAVNNGAYPRFGDSVNFVVRPLPHQYSIAATVRPLPANAALTTENQKASVPFLSNSVSCGLNDFSEQCQYLSGMLPEPESAAAIIQRDGFISAGANRVFVDPSAHRRGSLVAWNLRIHGRSGRTLTTNARLQIWRSIDGIENELRLVWEKRVLLSSANREGQNFRVTVDASEAFTFSKFSRIAVAFEQEHGIVSCSRGETYRTMVSVRSPLPSVGDQVLFRNYFVPLRMSFDVETTSQRRDLKRKRTQEFLRKISKRKLIL